MIKKKRQKIQIKKKCKQVSKNLLCCTMVGFPIKKIISFTSNVRHIHDKTNIHNLFKRKKNEFKVKTLKGKK